MNYPLTASLAISNTQSARVAGLDTLRFVAAFFVVMAHVLSEPPIFEWLGFNTSSGILKLVQGIYWKFFFTGISGVMVFFIISGLCIHLPNADSLRIDCLKSYFIRRLLRILPPVVPIVVLYQYADGLTIGQSITQTILWSVVCEVIYYLFYPVFLLVRRRYGHWWGLVGIAYLASIALILTDPSNTSFWSHGPWLTWILGLPCWLLGAALAEIIGKASQPAVTLKSIWAWRLGIWSVAALCVALKFRTPVGDPWTMNLFAFVAFFWIHREIVYFRKVRPNNWLESFGAWSFSLYITHELFWKFWREFWPIAKPYAFFEYFGTFAAVLIVAYCYYVIMERPTHKFSRFAANRIKSAEPIVSS